MNKHLYRIIFNHALGLCQAVSELVRRPGRGALQCDGTVSATVRPVSLGLWVAFGWIGVASIASAQIATDMSAPGNQRPTVMGSANAAPLINITTPSKAGVSRNTYNRFDMGAEGAVLNNSRTNTQTQLAGSVAGNPWLATGTAKVILNEVTGPNPSALNGLIEVAGDRAQVIVANPAGISCDGCGVINANRFTLTTGMPVLHGDALDGYRVTGGTIQINGNGLDARSADYTDIIARAVQVNGGLWSPQLQVTTGANEVSADHTQITSTSGLGEKPTFALDVGALGGMYANKIVLVGTEHGVGARNAGRIGAQAGDLVVTQDGRLENTGSLQSQASTQIAANGGIANAGVISAARELTITTPHDVDNSHGTLNAARVDVEASSLRNASGAIEQTASQGISLAAGTLTNRNGGRIGMLAADAGSGSGGVTSPPSDEANGGTGASGLGDTSDAPAKGSDFSGAPVQEGSAPLADGVLHITGWLDNDGGVIRAASGFDLASSTGLSNDGGQLALRSLTLAGGDLSNRGGALTIDGVSTVHANDVVNDGGQLSFAKPVAFDAQSLSNRAGTLTLADTAPMTLNVTGTLDNTAGLLASNASTFTLASGTLINERGTVNHAGADGFNLRTGDWQGNNGTVITAGTANVTAGNIDHRGATLAATQLTLHANGLDNRGGTLVTSGNAANTLGVSDVLDNGYGGTIQTQGDLAITAGTLGNADGAVYQKGQGVLSLQAGSVQGQGGALASEGSLMLKGGSFDLRNGNTSAQRIDADTDALTTAGGSFTSLGNERLNLTVRDLLDNTGGKVVGNGALQLTAGSLVNRNGELTAYGTDGTTLSVANTLDNTQGILAARGATAVQAGSLINQGGIVQTANGSPLTVTVSGALDNSQQGTLASEGDLTIRATTLDNTAGNISHSGHGAAVITAATFNGLDGSVKSNGSLRLTGGVFDLRGETMAQSIAVDTQSLNLAGGQLTALGDTPLSLNVRGLLDNTGGKVFANGALQLAAGSLVNRHGELTAYGIDGTTISVANALDNTYGLLAARGATAVQADSLINQNGTVQAVDGSPLTVTVSGALDNSQQGRLASEGDLTIRAATLDNTAGNISHSGFGATTIAATNLNGAAGTIASNGALMLTGGVIDLSGGNTQGKAITIDATSLRHTQDATLQALGSDALTLRVRDTLDNSGSKILANGALSLAAGSLVNRHGELTAYGIDGTTISVANALDNTYGLLAARGATAVQAGSLINQHGIVQAANGSPLTVTVSGGLDNSQQGTLASEGDLTIRAATLDNTAGNISHSGLGATTITATTLNGAGGTIASNGVLTLTGGAMDLSGGNTQAQAVTIDATSLNHTQGAMLQALGSDALTLRVRDTLDNSGSKILTNGALSLNAGMLLNHGGTLGAAGADASSLRIGGLFDNGGGQLSTAGITTVHAGSLNNAGGVISQTGTSPASQDVTGDGLTVTTDRVLVNDRGTLVTHGTLSLMAGDVSNYGGSVQAQQGINANITGSLDNTGGALVAGGDLSVKAQSLLNRQSLSFDPSALATGIYGQRVTLEAAEFDNTQGRVQSRDALTITGHALTNAGGVIDGTGTVAVSAATLDNTGGQLNQRDEDGTLLLDISQGLTNAAGGRIGAEGTANIHAGTFDNSGGTTFAWHDLTVASGGDLYNRDSGLLQTNGALTLDAQGALDNSGGIIDATGAATVHAQAINNVGGQLRAGAIDNPDAGLMVTSASTIDNRGGTLGNRGSDLSLSASGLDNSAGGTVVAQRDLRLDNIAVLSNVGGTVYAAGNLSYQNAAATLDNTNGILEAGGTAWLNLGTLTNHAAGRVQADTLWLTTPVLINDGGDIGANTLHATLASLQGLGSLHGTDLLDIHFLNDYTHLAGQQFQSDGTLSLTVDGTLTNQGTLQTQGALDVTAARLINQGTLRASNDAHTAQATLTVAGQLDNQPDATIEGDTLTLNATDITNTSTKGITGDVVRIHADTLTNGRDLGEADAAVAYGEGFIGAAQTLDLRVAQRLANLDGDLYSGGDLTIAGRAEGARVAIMDNVSGRIQADGDGSMAADVINNRRRVVETEQYSLSPDEQYALSSERAYDNALTPAEVQRMSDLYTKNNGRTGLTLAERQELLSYVHRLGYVHVDQVDAATLAAMNAVINQDAIQNHGHQGAAIVVGPDGNPAAELKQIDTYLTGTRVTRASAASQILTGGDLSIDLGKHLTNAASTIAATGDLTINGQHNDGTADARIDNIAVLGQYTLQRETDVLSLSALPVRYWDKNGSSGDTHADVFAVVGTENLTAAGPVLLASTISGRNVALSGHDINNTAVAASGGITTWNGGPLDGPDSTAQGDATHVQAGHAGTIDGARGDAVSGNDDIRRAQGQAITRSGNVSHTQGNTVSGAGTVAGAGAQVIGSADQPLPGLVAPSSGRYTQNGDPASPFLVTTAPRFATGSVTSSDYLLRALGQDPGNIHKRLGDGYVEQNLVLDQLLQLTGRRVLNGGDGLAQYQALMDGAAAEAARLGLQLGAPLTTAQISALSSDIVWLVDQVVDGQHVLVPVVYLSQATAERMKSDGALIAGDNVNLNASGTVRNDGTITGTQGTTISADTLINHGALGGGDRLAITTLGDTVNTGILRANTVGIMAGGSVINAPTFDGLAARGGVIQAGTGGVQIVAANDVINQGTVTSRGDAAIVAGRDYVQNAATSTLGAHASAGSLSAGGNAVVVAGRDALFDQSTITAGKVAYIDAGRDAVFTAATVSGGNSVGVVAGRDIVSDAVTSTTTTASFDKQGRTVTQSESSETTTRGSVFQSGGDVTMQAGRDISLVAANVNAEGAVGLSAGRDINLGAGQNTHSETTDNTRKHGNTKTTTHSEAEDTSMAGTTINGRQGVVMSAGQDINALAATVTSSDGAVVMHADRDINLLAGQNTHSETVDTQSTKKGFLSKKEITTHDGTYDTTAVGTTISGKDGIALNAGRNVLGIGTILTSSDGGIAITAGEQVALLAVQDTHTTEHSEKVRRSGFEVVPNLKQGTQKKTTTTEQATVVGSTLEAAGPIMVVSGGSQTYQAANIKSDTGTALVSGGAINFITATNSDTYQRDSSKHNVAYQAQDHRQRYDATEVQTSITGPVTMAAADGVNISVGQKQGETQDDAIARAAQQRDGTQWISEAKANPNVSFQSVDEQHIDEHQHHEGVTKAAGVVITVATAYVGGIAAGTLVDAGAAAGSTFAAGGLGNAVVAGAVGTSMGQGVGAAAQGHDWKQAALNGAIYGGLGAGLSWGVGELGVANGWSDGGWQRSLAHGAAGGASNVLTGGSFKNGFISGALGEASGYWVDQLPSTWTQAMGHAAAGAASSWATGGDAELGALNGLSGYMFNYLYHDQRTQRDADIAGCKGDSACVQGKQAQWQQASANQNVAMASGLIATGNIPPDLADALRSTDPSSSAYTQLLSQAVTYAPNTALNYALVNEVDGEAGFRATVGGWDSQARGQVETYLILPFAAPAAGALAATGAATTVPGVSAWGGDAWSAYRVASANYSLGAAAGTGAFVSGTAYTFSVAAGASVDSWKNGVDFSNAFNQRFSYLGLGAAMAVGTVNSMYATQMYQWAGVPNAFSNVLTPAGATIRANSLVAGKVAGMAAQGAVSSHEQQKQSENK